MPQLNKRFWENEAFVDQDIPTLFAEGLERIHENYYLPAASTFAYAAFANSSDYSEYTNLVRGLTQFDLATLDSAEAQLAFWLNVYNSLVIHNIVFNGVEQSVQDVRGFFSEYQHGVGDQIFSLDDIEHGILRGNAKKYLGLKPLFGKYDNRLSQTMTVLDCRVHFGLYSACQSSPPWQVFTPDRVSEQLADATSWVLKRDVRIDEEALSLQVPKIFQWYERDFGNQEAIARFIVERLDESDSQKVLQHNVERCTLDYLEFDWTLNSHAIAQA